MLMSVLLGLDQGSYVDLGIADMVAQDINQMTQQLT